MAREEFKKILEKLNNGSYKKNFITIESYEDSEESLQDTIGDEEVILLCEALKKNPHVEKIKLLLQDVGDKGAQALAEVDTIKDIFISCGHVKALGGRALAEAKLKALAIEGCDIYLDENDYESREVNKFIDALIDNKTIERLDLLHTYIDSNLLVKLIENTKSIKLLFFGRRDLDRDLVKELHISQKEMQVYVGEEKIILLGDEIQDNSI